MTGHIPVLLDKVIEALAPKDGAMYVDGTFGGGGYTKGLLEAANCNVIAIDRDPDAILQAQGLRQVYGERLRVVQGRFGDMAPLLKAQHIEKVSGITLDLGVSSMQLDQAVRGFSFRFSGPLDMRMEQKGVSAADLVNRMEEKALADLIFNLGEERKARSIARSIVAARISAPITRTEQLADIVRRAVGPSKDRHIDPATRTFQALRIAVNDELEEIDRALNASANLLEPAGRIAIVTFHSLEDRRVKQFFRDKTGKLTGQSRHLPPRMHKAPTFKIIHPKGIVPDEIETKLNARARSARLRVAERLVEREAA